MIEKIQHATASSPEGAKGLAKDYAKDGRFSAVTAFADIDPESIL